MSITVTSNALLIANDPDDAEQHYHRHQDCA